MYITLTKKRIFVVLCTVVLALIMLGQFFSVKANEIDASTNLKRVQFVSTLGISLISDDYTEKTVTIPVQFSEVYMNYNALQREAGFDLLGYKGKRVKVYTYNIDSQTVVNLMVYNNKLIGGDIASLKIDGQMIALKEIRNDDRTV